MEDLEPARAVGMWGTRCLRDGRWPPSPPGAFSKGCVFAAPRRRRSRAARGRPRAAIHSPSCPQPFCAAVRGYACSPCAIAASPPSRGCPAAPPRTRPPRPVVARARHPVRRQSLPQSMAGAADRHWRLEPGSEQRRQVEGGRTGAAAGVGAEGAMDMAGCGSPRDRPREDRGRPRQARRTHSPWRTRPVARAADHHRERWRVPHMPIARAGSRSSI